MSIKIFNVVNNGTVHTPLLIVHGESKVSASGVITVGNKGNAYPPLSYEVNQGFFKLVVHLDPGRNPLNITHYQGTMKNGYPAYTKNGPSPFSIDFTINYVPLIQNRPVHLCLLLASDSPAVFDSTSIKRGQEGNGLDVAIRKLRVGARMMQAFTSEQMLRGGFGNRTFNFVEEYTVDTQFAQEKQNRKLRNTVKIHIIRSKKTLKELRDPNIAQQNPKGTKTGDLFGIAMEALRDYGGPFDKSNRPVQAAVMFMDTHWDKKLNLILTHAALGGGDSDIKLAIFGSHGLYSWPTSLEEITPCFQDTTISSKDEVANDCNECGSYWECMAITLGAFMHEIGHLLGSPHQVSGVMLRDYVTLNRSFLTREVYSTRTKKNGLTPILPKDECAWNRLDLLRFLHHPSFTLPEDYLDPTFGKSSPASGNPLLLPMGNDTVLLKSATGIYAVEVCPGDLAEAHLEYLPKSVGGSAPVKELYVTSSQLRALLPKNKQSCKDFNVRALCVDGAQPYYTDFCKLASDNNQFVQLDLGLGKGLITGIKSHEYGSKNNKQVFPVLPFNPLSITRVRIYHGGALDGVRIYTRADSQSSLKENKVSAPPPVPQRDYKSGLHSVLSKFKSLGTSDERYTGPTSSTLFGHETGHYTDFELFEGEYIKQFIVRSGQWVDALQVFTNTGRSSPLCGNVNGGSEGVVAAPDGYEVAGIFGSCGDWVDSIGFVFVPAN